MTLLSQKQSTCSPLRVLFAGGGTGGHLIPALAVADGLRAAHPDAEILFVGTADRIEATKVPASGFDFAPITVHGIAGKWTPSSLASRLLAVGELLCGIPIWQSLGILRRFRPDVVVGSGGYVCGPVILAAWLLKRPAMVLEQNEIAGVTTRSVARYISLAAVTSEGAGAFFRERGVRTEVIGNPVRPAVLSTTREEGVAALGLDPTRKTLAIVGGSLGSVPVTTAAFFAISELVKEPWFRDGWQTVHLFGSGRSSVLDKLVPVVRQEYPTYHIYPFLDNIHHLLAATDLIVTRAGGTFLAEIAVRGVPMIVIPWSGAAGDHQTRNAAPFVAAGAARLITDAALSPDSLYAALRTLLSDTASRATMAAACRRLGHPEATARAVALIEELAGC